MNTTGFEDPLATLSTRGMGPYLAYATLGLLALLYLRSVRASGNWKFDAPVVGSRNPIRARWDFFRNASTLVNEGYSKYKNEIFKLSSNDILVLPTRYVNELRNMPDEDISSIQANIDNFEGLYSTTAILLEGNLHTRMIQSRLTPRLRYHVPIVQSLLSKHIPTEVMAAEDKSEGAGAFHVVLRLISFIAARHFVGYPLCENDEWLETALNYTENAFKTIILLRIFPDWAKPLVSLFIPFSYKVNWALAKAKRIIVPLIEERRRSERSDAGYEKPHDFLQYLMDGATGTDAEPDKLAHRLLILTLAAVHTTSMAATQALFDLCAHPEYIEPLRNEVIDVLRAEGGYTKQSLTYFKKLDSFIRESQRLNPPSLLGFKRAVRKPVTLSDGTYLPAGVHLMVPISPVVTDQDVTPDPLTFDGLRHYNNRTRLGEATRHQFSTTSATNLHFGHGKFACPGRFLAGNSIKMLLSNILLRYDVCFAAGGADRPPNVHLHEYVFPNPYARVEFRPRERQHSESGDEKLFHQSAVN